MFTSMPDKQNVMLLYFKVFRKLVSKYRASGPFRQQRMLLSFTSGSLKGYVHV